MSTNSDIEFQKENERLNELQKEYEESYFKNLCVQCGIDLGYMNPRQYCGKTYCYNINEETDKEKK